MANPGPAFNIDLNVADLQVLFDEPAEGETIEFVKLIQVIGLGVPIGPQQAGLIGIGTTSSILGRDELEKLIEGATEALKFMPVKPKLPDNFAIAGNMEQARAFDAELKKAQGGQA